MSFRRFPHTALISWRGAGTVNSVGTFTNGTLTTVSIACKAQPQSQRYVIDSDGNSQLVRYSISTALMTASVDKKTANVNVFDRDYKLIDLMNYQLHTELEC